MDKKNNVLFRCVRCKCGHAIWEHRLNKSGDPTGNVVASFERLRFTRQRRSVEISTDLRDADAVVILKKMEGSARLEGRCKCGMWHKFSWTMLVSLIQRIGSQ